MCFRGGGGGGSHYGCQARSMFRVSFKFHSSPLGIHLVTPRSRGSVVPPRQGLKSSLGSNGTGLRLMCACVRNTENISRFCTFEAASAVWGGHEVADTVTHVLHAVVWLPQTGAIKLIITGSAHRCKKELLKKTNTHFYKRYCCDSY